MNECASNLYSVEMRLREIREELSQMHWDQTHGRVRYD